jgi:uncharacterized membrane protein
LVLHLWIQQARGFDHGCWGLSSSPASSDGCREVASLNVRAFGIPVVIWGYVFYLAMAALCLARSIAIPKIAVTCHKMGIAAVALAVPQTGYLVYLQFSQLHTFCALCLVSAVFVAALGIIHLLYHLQGGYVPPNESQRTAEYSYAAITMFLAFGGGVGILFFVNRLGLNGSDDSTVVSRMRADFALGGNVRTTSDLRTEDWTKWNVPPMNGDARIPVVFFLDPNCPHCSETFDQLTVLSDQYRGQAAFYVYPRLLWKQSLLQIEAIELARQQGKYYEMWRAQFEHRTPQGANQAELTFLFKALHLDGSALNVRLAAVRSVVIGQTYAAASAGVYKTPTGFIAGRLVPDDSLTAPKLRQLLDHILKEDGSVLQLPTPPPGDSNIRRAGRTP